MSEKTKSSDLPSPRGYAVDDVWYPYSNELLGQGGRNVQDAVAEVAVAIHDLELARSELSALVSLLFVVRVSSVVLEDIHQLCQGCTEVMAAICSSRETLSSRARASVAHDERQFKKYDQR